MKELNFETGLETYTINGGVKVAFNPTDDVFVERLFDSFNALADKQEKYQKRAEKTANKREIFDTARQIDKEIREMLDGLFETPICDAAFGKMNVCALAGGLPAWSNLLFAIMDEIDTTFAREQKATNERIKKYSAKYQKK